MKRLIHSRSLNSIKSLIRRRDYPQALRASVVSLPDPLPTDQTYALFIKYGHTLDSFLSSILISYLSKSGEFSRAHGILSDTKDPDAVTFNALISGYASFGWTKPVFELFDRLRHLGLRPDEFTLSALVKGCKSSEENLIAHGVCLRIGFGSTAYLVSGLLENYARAGDIGSAEKCFSECFVLDPVVWVTMVSGYVWNGEFEKGKEVFVEMNELGMEINAFSLSAVLGALFEVREGKQIHGIGVKMGFSCACSTHLNNAIMHMYSRCGYKLDAVKVFDEITDPDIVSWAERIGAARDYLEGLELFRLLHSRGIEINEYILVNVLSAISNPQMLPAVEQIQALCYKKGYLLGSSVSNSFIAMYGKSGRMDDANCVFNDMCNRDSVSWNSLIAAYSENGLLSEALKLFSQMRESLQPNLYTLASLLEGASNSCSLKLATQIHSYMIKYGLTFDQSMVSCLITAYAKCNGIDESKRVFFETDEISFLHLNGLLSSLLQAGYHDDALNMFAVSRRLNFELDATIFSIVIKACGAITDLEQGRVIHSLAFRYGFNQDSFVRSAVIDMYFKCGSITDAENTFRFESSDNLAVWNAMIMGYAHHGRHHEVSFLLDGISELGIKPDGITFLGVLTAFRHTGLVKEAVSCLNSMFELHRVKPSLEHYSCVVDLLGQAGLLEEAKRTIDEMPFNCDAHIWQILLSACSIHGNVDLGIVAASKLLEMQPENESAYLLLSSIYASAGNWNAVRRLRTEMKEKVVKKEPGSSWIQIGKITHSFLAGGTSHINSKEIYEELSRLYRQMSPSLEGASALPVET